MATVSGTPTTIANGGNYTAGAGSNRVVLFGVSFVDDTTTATATGITMGAASATRIGGIGGIGANPYAYVDLWRINEAATIPGGANAVSVSYSTGVTTTRVHCITIQDAHQTDFSVTDTDSTASGTSLAALSVTSLDDSVAFALASLIHDAGNTGVTPNWTGATEVGDGTSGAPSQRYWSAYRNVTTGTTESIAPSWDVAVAAVGFAVVVKNFAAGGSVPRNLLLMGVG